MQKIFHLLPLFYLWMQIYGIKTDFKLFSIFFFYMLRQKFTPCKNIFGANAKKIPCIRRYMV